MTSDTIQPSQWPHSVASHVLVFYYILYKLVYTKKTPIYHLHQLLSVWQLAFETDTTCQLPVWEKYPKSYIRDLIFSKKIYIYIYIRIEPTYVFGIAVFPLLLFLCSVYIVYVLSSKISTRTKETSTEKPKNDNVQADRFQAGSVTN